MESGEPLSHAKADNHSQSVSVVISDKAAQWIALFIILGIAIYAAIEGQIAQYDADKMKMNYELTYSHELKIEAYLEARGMSPDSFLSLPKPEKHK